MKFIDFLCANFPHTTMVIKHETPNPEQPQRSDIDSLSDGLEAPKEWDAVMVATALAVDAIYATHCKQSARIFLMPSPLVSVYESALYWSGKGYRLVFHDGRVEIVR